MTNQEYFDKYLERNKIINFIKDSKIVIGLSKVQEA